MRCLDCRTNQLARFDDDRISKCRERSEKSMQAEPKANCTFCSRRKNPELVEAVAYVGFETSTVGPLLAAADGQDVREQAVTGICGQSRGWVWLRDNAGCGAVPVSCPSHRQVGASDDRISISDATTAGICLELKWPSLGLFMII